MPTQREYETIANDLRSSIDDVDNAAKELFEGIEGLGIEGLDNQQFQDLINTAKALLGYLDDAVDDTVSECDELASACEQYRAAVQTGDSDTAAALRTRYPMVESE